MKLIDTHTHLYLKEFDSDFDQVVRKSNDIGIKKFIFPSIHSKYNERMISTYNKDRSLFNIMAGLHPSYVCNNNDEEIDLVIKNLKIYDCVAVGEIGIDLFWEKKFFDQQILVFEKQIQLALDYNLPIVIHCREAFDHIYNILKKYSKHNLSGVFHCFTGNEEQANKICDLNFKFGIGGVVTFKNGGLDKFLNKIDIKNIVLETDSPYLAPTPHRGKRNDSSYLIYIVDKLCEIYGLENYEIASITTNNAVELFNLDK
ncbi:MAG: hydrolase TatD [Flavobacteriaceae bacterium]|nr:hydrolase TatD [Flavobacteriaceae bacterium]